MDRRPARSSRSSAAVVIGRLLLVAIAAGAAAAGFLQARSSRPPGAEAGVHWVCPMHPVVISDRPRQCPICGMDLERKVDAAPEEKAAAASPGESPTTFTLHADVRGWDTVSKAKRVKSALEMRAPAWADESKSGVALYHLDETELIRPGEIGFFAPVSGPRSKDGRGIHVRVSSQPPVRRDDGMALVRFDADPGAELVPGETGTLKLAFRLRDGLAIRNSAVIHSPEGTHVLVLGADRRTLEKRPVVIGNVIAKVVIGTTVYDYANLVSGMREGEYALARHTFVLEVERRLARRSTP